MRKTEGERKTERQTGEEKSITRRTSDDKTDDGNGHNENKSKTDRERKTREMERQKILYTNGDSF